MELFEKDKKVQMAGLPWMEHNTFNLFSRKSLVSNILCTNHNEALSDCDIEAGKLFRCIKEFDDDFNSPNPREEHSKFNGHNLEKWMLKVVCGLIASNQVASEGKQNRLILKDEFIDILFNDGIWPNYWGLYFAIPNNKQIHKYDCMSFMPRTAYNEIKAGEFLINNFQFNLILGRPDMPDHWGVYRINKIFLTDGVIRKTIEFEWDNKRFDKWIEFKRIRTSSEPPGDWENWMKKI
ncbi:MAG: hypothetical protein QM764_00660 [Chitinophagaceae bacterium]